MSACQFSTGVSPDDQAITPQLGRNPVPFPLHIDSWGTAQPTPGGITVYGIGDPARSRSSSSQTARSSAAKDLDALRGRKRMFSGLE